MRLIDAEDEMTNAEAIETLRANYPDACFWQLREAVDKAIKALEEPQRTGRWIPQKGGGLCCSECGGYALDEPDGNFVHVAVPSKFCPHCGARMEGDEE